MKKPNKYNYPITTSVKDASDGETDNNISIGESTQIGDYRVLAATRLDPSTIKDWNSTRKTEKLEYLNGPATNSVTYENAELKVGMYWVYDNTNGYFILKK